MIIPAKSFSEHWCARFPDCPISAKRLKELVWQWRIFSGKQIIEALDATARKRQHYALDHEEDIARYTRGVLNALAKTSVADNSDLEQHAADVI